MSTAAPRWTSRLGALVLVLSASAGACADDEVGPGKVCENDEECPAGMECMCWLSCPEPICTIYCQVDLDCERAGIAGGTCELKGPWGYPICIPPGRGGR